MNIKFLHSLTSLVDNHFNVSRTAQQLCLVQPAVSQHIQRLENELRLKIFVRQGKRLVGLTEAGEKIVHYARKLVAEEKNIIEIGREHVEHATGVLRIGTTHTQARYVLTPVIKLFNRAYPKVELQIHQGTPQQLVEMALDDRVDFSICTELLASNPLLTTVPCYQWNRSLIAAKGHPLLQRKHITLKALCSYPLITYVFGFTGRGHFNMVFSKSDLQPSVVLSAADTDVIKTYVREGMGVGIIASMAYTREQDSDLELRDLSHLFPWEITSVAYPAGKYLRQYQQHFIDLFQSCAAKTNQWSGLLPV